MKKIILIVIIILAVISAGFFYLKYDVLKSKDFKPDNSKAKTVLDLRPAIIAKLQQLVKDGSEGLYKLTIEKLDPDILSSKLDLIDGTVSVDTAAMLQMDKDQKLPDDVFNIKFHALHIDGIGISDLLHKKNIDITGAYLNNPEIHIYHKTRPYNKEERRKNDSLTLYQRLMREIDKIAIGSININHGILIIHNVEQQNRITRFNDITVRMNNVLIDSSTQYDAGRFLFAKHAELETHNYIFRTGDSLYTVKLGTIKLTGEKHSIRISNASLTPRGNRQQFEKKLRGRDQMYTVNFPMINMADMDWWNLVNREKIIAKKMEINGGTVSIYYDESVPLGPPKPRNHFPHQLVMMIPVPVLVDELKLDHLKVIYTQYKPDTKASGTSIFTNVNGSARHITNIPAEIKRSKYTVLSASGLFMNKVPLTATFKFDLMRQRTGHFYTVIHMGTLDKELINPISERLGKFNVKRGQMQEGNANIEGDNSTLHATMDVHYTDLHITPLKIDTTSGGRKKSHLKSFFANIIFIKNDNPNDGELRKPEYYVDRDHYDNFVSFIWHTLMAGLLKTIGIPVKLVMKEDK